MKRALVMDSKSPPFRMTVFYLPKLHAFEIWARHDNGTFAASTIRATWEPRFGIDAADRADIDAEAENLIRDMTLAGLC